MGKTLKILTFVGIMGFTSLRGLSALEGPVPESDGWITSPTMVAGAGGLAAATATAYLLWSDKGEKYFFTKVPGVRNLYRHYQDLVRPYKEKQWFQRLLFAIKGLARVGIGLLVFKSIKAGYITEKKRTVEMRNRGQEITKKEENISKIIEEPVITEQQKQARAEQQRQANAERIRRARDLINESARTEQQRQARVLLRPSDVNIRQRREEAKRQQQARRREALPDWNDKIRDENGMTPQKEIEIIEKSLETHRRDPEHIWGYNTNSELLVKMFNRREELKGEQIKRNLEKLGFCEPEHRPQ